MTCTSCCVAGCGLDFGKQGTVPIIATRSQSKRHPIGIVEVRAAGRALTGLVSRTPLLENADVNEAFGGRYFNKAECAQRTGAFKIRGAHCRILLMTAEKRAREGRSATPPGTTRLASRAAQMLGSTALIVMPSDAPAAKVAATRALGAMIVTFDRGTDSSDEVVARLRDQTGRIVVPPSAHRDVLAGAGTVALEMLKQADAMSARLDAILISCGGDGLTASTAIVASAISPRTEDYAVEPLLFDDTRRSLQAGRPVPNPVGRRTICNAIMTPIPNDMTFPINRQLLAGGLTASDREVRDAMRFAFEHFKMVIEPGAAVGIAAVLNDRINIRGRTVATVATGGNIDVERYHSLVAEGER